MMVTNKNHSYGVKNLINLDMDNLMSDFIVDVLIIWN